MRLSGMGKAKVNNLICPHDDEKLLSEGSNFVYIGWYEYLHCPRCKARYLKSKALLGSICVDDTSDW